jgi:hypothetical protein
MGEDRPFQDVGLLADADPPDPNDVTFYGSGLSGRAASLALPARADTGERPALSSDTPPIDTRWPAFLALGRKMIFDRPEADNLPIVSPPARYLSPTEARAVVPVAADLRGVLKHVVKGEAAPIVPPHVERTAFGLRPGAMQAEFDMLLFGDGPDPKETQQEEMSAEFGRFGRPGHAGPRLVRQLRPPRGPALPRIPLGQQNFVTTHGRRTFVELDDGDGRFPTPFRLFEGVATVLRRHYAKDKTNPDDTVDESYWIRILDMPLAPEWRGELQLLITSPSYPDKDNASDELAKLLVKIGLLKDGKDGLGATLSIDRVAVPFSRASYKKGKDSANGLAAGVLTLMVASEDMAGVRAHLDAVDGDSEVIFQLRCAMESSNQNVPTSPFDLATKSGGPATDNLEPETRRQIALRLPVRPTARPSISIDTHSLAFADPSYDRELSGPGPADPQRDNSGLLWKVALDRFEYGTDTPVYFAFGPIDPKTGLFTDTPKPAHALLLVQRQQATKENKTAPPAQDLLIAGVKPSSGHSYDIKTKAFYALTLDRLRDVKTDQQVTFGDGDQIVVSVTFTLADGVLRTASVRAIVVPRPIIAPPPAVYALVAPFGDSKTPKARVVLHATAPLPQRIEFPDLLSDLAIGHIRRRALFLWTSSDAPSAAPTIATLIKIDRAGGGQLPESKSDLLHLTALP